MSYLSGIYSGFFGSPSPDTTASTSQADVHARVQAQSRPQPEPPRSQLISAPPTAPSLIDSMTSQHPIDGSALLKRKLAHPNVEFTPEERLVLLTHCIFLGNQVARQATDKHLIVVIGDTGAGKSTFINSQIGCTMRCVTPKSIGCEGFDDVFVVVPKEKGGKVDEVMRIGHDTAQSMTFMPQLVSVTEDTVYCDSPGRLDTTKEFRVVNSVNIKNVFAAARSVRVVMLIEYSNFLSQRAGTIDSMFKSAMELFRSAENLIKFKESILVGITKIPRATVAKNSMAVFRNYFTTPPFRDRLQQLAFGALADRLFIYDPEDNPQLEISGAWDRTTIRQKIAALILIQNPVTVFATSLTPEDYQSLNNIYAAILEKIQKIFSQQTQQISDEDFRLGAYYFDNLSQLQKIDHTYVNELVKKARKVITDHFVKMKMEISISCLNATTQLSLQSEEFLNKLKRGIQHFDLQIQADAHLDTLEADFKLSKDKFKAREEATLIYQMAEKFYSYCLSDRQMAEDQLSKIREKIAFFENTYGHTEVKHNVDPQELQKGIEQLQKNKEEAGSKRRET